MGTIRAELHGRVYEVPSGTSIDQILAAHAPDDSAAVAAALNNHVVSLRTALFGSASIRPVHPSEPEGQSVVRRSVCHVVLAALADVGEPVRVRVGQSIIGGYFYEVEPTDGVSIDLDGLCIQLAQAVERWVDADSPFHHRAVSLEAALDSLSDPFGTKGSLLRSWASPTVPIVELGGFVDIQHGPYAPSSRCAAGARIVPFESGLVVRFPGAPELRSAHEGHRLFDSYKETRDWNRKIGVSTVGDLNRNIIEGDVSEVVRIAEAFHEKKVAEIADAIALDKDRVHIVCVAGPSSAGKTTFVQRLSVQLRVNGIEPVSVGLDDYYRAREEYPLDDRGERDYEALEALDLELIDQHLSLLLRGREIRVPRFDFALGHRAPESTWRPVRLDRGKVLLLEGIHGLNPRLTQAIPSDARFRIFINALTQLLIDEHNRIFTSDARFLRRIVRDRRYRGTSAAETIQRWPSVRRGEERWIFPFQEQADAMFNSTLVYETAVLKTFAWRYLLEVPRDHPARSQAYRLLKFLELFVPVFPDDVPATSVLREFLGGSGFSY